MEVDRGRMMELKEESKRLKEEMKSAFNKKPPEAPKPKPVPPPKPSKVCFKPRSTKANNRVFP